MRNPHYLFVPRFLGIEKILKVCAREVQRRRGSMSYEWTSRGVIKNKWRRSLGRHIMRFGRKFSGGYKRVSKLYGHRCTRINYSWLATVRYGHGGLGALFEELWDHGMGDGLIVMDRFARPILCHFFYSFALSLVVFSNEKNYEWFAVFIVKV